jgi:hypothetical protein
MDVSLPLILSALFAALMKVKAIVNRFPVTDQARRMQGLCEKRIFPFSLQIKGTEKKLNYRNTDRYSKINPPPNRLKHTEAKW